MSKPRRIFLVRHGESEGNVDRSIYARVPDWKVELTTRGREQAREAGKRLAVESNLSTDFAAYVSPYHRTRQTLDEMLKAPLWGCRWIKEDPRLREQEWGGAGTFDPRSWSEIEAERDAYGTFFYRFPHGESGADVYDRCTGFLDTLYRDFQQDDYPEDVLIVGHGFQTRVLLMRWLHWSVEDFQGLKNPPNASVFQLQLDDTNHYRPVTPFPRWPVVSAA